MEASWLTISQILFLSFFGGEHHIHSKQNLRMAIFMFFYFLDVPGVLGWARGSLRNPFFTPKSETDAERQQNENKGDVGYLKMVVGLLRVASFEGPGKHRFKTNAETKPKN